MFKIDLICYLVTWSVMKKRRVDPLHLGGLRLVNALCFVSCAHKLLQLELCPRTLAVASLFDCSVSCFELESSSEVTAGFWRHSPQEQ